MNLLSSTLSVLFAVVSFAIVAQAEHNPISHPQVHRAHVNRSLQRADHNKRMYNGFATWFVTGLGACGNYNQPSDFIVAQNMAQYDAANGGNCGKQIRITAMGKTALAVIEDRCVACDYDSLDFTSGLFKFFTDLGTGQFPIQWEYTDGSGGGGPTTTTWTPSPTPTPDPTTTTQPPTTTTPPSTTEQATTSTLTSTSINSSSTSDSASTLSSTSVTGSSVSGTSTGAQGASTPGSGQGAGSSSGSGQGGNIAVQQMVVANLGSMISSGKSS